MQNIQELGSLPLPSALDSFTEIDKVNTNKLENYLHVKKKAYDLRPLCYSVQQK